MGMSSSQARLLSITARMNDVEFKSQSIANTKIRLADESEAVSKAYTEALGKSRLMYSTWDTNGHKVTTYLDSDAIFSSTTYQLFKEDGTQVTSGSFTEYELYDMIESGQYYLKKLDNNEESETYGDYVRTSIAGDNQLAIGSVDSAELAKAEADYNAATARINRKEKLLDNEMKALDTEHNALKTEQDSIKSLIKDNVDKTFNIFG